MELHPAFMRNGDVLDGFYVGAYECSADEATGGICIAPNQKPIVGENKITFKRRIQNSDMHCVNIYERIAVLTLALFETTTATRSLQESFGNGDNIQDARLIANTGTTNNVYRGIHELWANTHEYVETSRNNRVLTPGTLDDFSMSKSSFKMYTNRLCNVNYPLNNSTFDYSPNSFCRNSFNPWMNNLSNVALSGYRVVWDGD